jgi:hypothetical protein
MIAQVESEGKPGCPQWNGAPPSEVGRRARCRRHLLTNGGHGMAVLPVHDAPDGETSVSAASTLLSQRRSWWRSFVQPAS